MTRPSDKLFRKCCLSGPPQWYLDALEEKRLHPQFEATDIHNGRRLYHVSMGRMMGVNGG